MCGVKNSLHQKGRFSCVHETVGGRTSDNITHFQIYLGLGFGTETLLEVREIQQKTERPRNGHGTADSQQQETVSREYSISLWLDRGRNHRFPAAKDRIEKCSTSLWLDRGRSAQNQEADAGSGKIGEKLIQTRRTSRGTDCRRLHRP